ncbi:MAG: DUF4019 domain-containing protein [Nibricoccus sp.]
MIGRRKILQRSSASFAHRTFLILYALHLLWAFSTADELPARVASHFGVSGRADGFMIKSSYLAFTCLVPLVLGFFLQVLARIVVRLPDRFINVPHRAIWLAPDRRHELTHILAAWLAALSCGLVILFAQIHTLTLLANRLQPPRLPDIALFTLIGFPIVFLLWAVGFLMRLAEPLAPAKSHQRRTLILTIVGTGLLGFFAAPAIAAWNTREIPSAPDSRPTAPSTPSAKSAAPEARQEILRLKLAEAKTRLATVQDRMKNGLTSRAELDTAQDEIAIIEAELAGDGQKIARIKIATAQRRLNDVSERYKAGAATQGELYAAKDELAISEAELRGDALTIAQTIVAAAERRVNEVNDRYKTGSATYDEVSSAKTDLNIRQVELDALVRSKSSPTAATLVIVIQEDGTYLVDSRVVSFDELNERLAKFSLNAPDGMVHIKAHNKVSYALMPAVTKAIRLNHLNKMSFETFGPPRPEELAMAQVPKQAQAWLQQIDEGRFAESWAASSPLFRQSITGKDWAASLDAVRTPLGALASRFHFVSETVEKLPNIPGGPHIVCRFATCFENKTDAVETVTFTRDTDGIWRASGYFIK